MEESPIPLSYELLCRQVEQYIKQSTRELPGVIERSAFWIALGSAALALGVASMVPRWLSPTAALPIVTAGLVIEMAGFVVSMALTLKREVPKFWHARRKHADEMDSDFRGFRDIVLWLGRYSPSDRSERLRFVRSLKNNMSYRLGLATGGVERLGIFPILVALYLQFKDWEWGNWSALVDVNLVGGFLIWMMVLLYGVGWMVIGLKVRLDTYELLLEESLHSESE